MMFDPVAQVRRRLPLEHHERVKEAIYAWMETEAGTGEERAAWEHFRRAAKAWLANSRARP
jgi:hypothetical protein